MTEIDALTMAKIDMAHSARILQRAKGPNDIILMFKKFFVHRAKATGDGRVKLVVRRILKNTPSSGKLPSAIVSKCIRTLAALERLCEPEDTRAIMLWMAGTREEGPGYVQQLLMALQAPGTQEALGSLEAAIEQTRERLAEDDRELFQSQCRLLNGPEKAIVQGEVIDARIASKDGDGETSRQRLVTARKLARYLVAQQQHNSA